METVKIIKEKMGMSEIKERARKSINNKKKVEELVKR